jgi:hypothetical protein
MSDLYIKLADALAVLDALKEGRDADARIAISEAALQLVFKVDVGAMSMETHNRMMSASLDAAFGGKS